MEPSMNTLRYLFDPLCGWCYGASATVAALAAAQGVRLELLPSGLFRKDGARPMDDGLAAYAWSNDQRIERLTGQCFSQRYRDHVLADRVQRFDSGPATCALTAVSMTTPEREVDALKAIQLARYVDGKDVTRIDVLAATLDALGLPDAARMLRADTPALHAVVDARVAEAQAVMRQFGARGVPSFVLESGGRRQLLRASAAYSDPAAFVAQATAA
jgi:putative protein-disulfide isomerase